MIRSLIKRLTHPLLKRVYDHRAKKPRNYSYGNVELVIYPGVFSPEMTISTKLFVDYLHDLDLEGKSVLELGAGSGLLGFSAERLGAMVTFSDISPAAIDGLTRNVQSRASAAHVVQSDFFEALPEAFDFVLINPPFYPLSPKNMEERAWYCGENFDYFESLFEQLRLRDFPDEMVLMILSQDCDLERIQRIALKNYFRLDVVHETSAWKEVNRIYSVLPA